MAHVVAPNLRGKGNSRTKLSKTGEPKHAGNFSASTIHYQSLQSKDYKVRLIDGELIVGDHTRLTEVLPAAVNELALNDPSFDEYRAVWHHTHGIKRYEAQKTLTKRKVHYQCEWMNYDFTYREAIYTEGDFTYRFPEY